MNFTFQILNYAKNTFNGILEIGFGSGILSIILAKELGLKITACDINLKALELALENAKLHKVDHLIDFKLCNFKQIKENYDFIFQIHPILKFISYRYLGAKRTQRGFYLEEKKDMKLEEIIHFSLDKKLNFSLQIGYDQKFWKKIYIKIISLLIFQR